jgi:hypothetical protein
MPDSLKDLLREKNALYLTSLMIQLKCVSINCVGTANYSAKHQASILLTTIRYNMSLFILESCLNGSPCTNCKPSLIQLQSIRMSDTPNRFIKREKLSSRLSILRGNWRNLRRRMSHFTVSSNLHYYVQKQAQFFSLLPMNVLSFYIFFNWRIYSYILF